MKQFVTYVYFNPLKKCEATECGYEAFYVGQGIRGRELAHLNNLSGPSSRHKKNTIKQILSANQYPIIEIVFESDNADEVKTEEIRLIALYGRADLQLGTLTNHTNGGEGQSGAIFSNSHRNKLSRKTSEAHADGKLISNTDAWSRAGLIKAHSEEGRAKSALARTGLKRSGAGRRNISEARKAYISNLTPSERKIKFGTTRGRKHSALSLDLMSKKLIEVFKRPEVKQKRSEANSGGKNPRSKRVSVFGNEYSYIGEAESQTGISKYKLKQEESFRFL